MCCFTDAEKFNVLIKAVAEKNQNHVRKRMALKRFIDHAYRRSIPRSPLDWQSYKNEPATTTLRSGLAQDQITYGWPLVVISRIASVYCPRSFAVQLLFNRLKQWIMKSKSCWYAIDNSFHRPDFQKTSNSRLLWLATSSVYHLFLGSSQEEAAHAVGQRGVRVVLSKKTEAVLLNWILVSSHLCAVRLNGSVGIRKDSGIKRSLFILSVCATKTLHH